MLHINKNCQITIEIITYFNNYCIDIFNQLTVLRIQQTQCTIKKYGDKNIVFYNLFCIKSQLQTRLNETITVKAGISNTTFILFYNIIHIHYAIMNRFAQRGSKLETVSRILLAGKSVYPLYGLFQSANTVNSITNIIFGLKYRLHMLYSLYVFICCICVYRKIGVPVFFSMVSDCRQCVKKFWSKILITWDMFQFKFNLC